MATNKKSVFEVLSAINCNGHTEKKNGLTYLSWAWAWQMVKQNYPEATYTIYENRDGLNYHHDGKTAWVKTGVTIEGIELIEDLPVMDFRNASIKLDNITSFDVNKAIQRSLTKACARHGLGLYIYAGEDLPDGVEPETSKETAKSAPTSASKPSTPTSTAPAKKAAQSGSTVPSALREKAKEAWKIFNELESVKSMDDQSRTKFFRSTLKSKVGKEDPAKLSTDDWDKVVQELDMMRVI